MAVVRKKQDDKNLKILREIVTTGAGNRQCFDCGQKGPTYVNMTIGSFVCTRCSGVLRGLTPPHRVKSISMATFTPEEIEFLKSHGNDLCGKTWLGLWDPKRIIHQDQRELMIDKYERKRYYLEPASPLKSLTTATVPTVTTKLSSSISSLSSSSSSSNNLNNLSNYNNISNNNCSSQQIISNGGNINNSGSNSINSLNSNKFNDNSFKNITLTPPTSSRLHNGNSNRQQQTNGFKDDNNIFMNGHTNNNHHQPRPIVTNKASLNISSSLDSSSSNNSLNGFTPDSDFIADFNTANIFNATTTSNQQNGFQNGGGGSVNGPIRNGNNFINNGGNNFVNGIGNNSTSNVNENFADFDHAPIYNAAGFPISGRNNSLTTSNTTLNSTPSIDRYAALKDLDEQLRETKVSTTAEPFMNGTTPVSNPNPFKTSSPSMPIQQNQQQQQIANPFQSSTTNGNGLFGSPQQQQSMLQQHHQLQQQNLLQQQQQQQLQMQQQIQMHQQQQQQHQQQQQLFNNNGVGGANVGFGTNTNFGLFNFNNGNDFNGGVANGNGYNNNTNNNNIVQQQQQQPTMISTGANGCGMMGFGGGHQITAGSNMSNMKNPFTASNVLNSNNPFL